MKELDDIPLTLRAGGFYLQEELDLTQNTVGRPGFVDPLLQEYTQETWSFGAFTDFVWDVWDDVTLEGGFRYNWERKRFDAEIFRGFVKLDACRTSPSGIEPPCVRTETVDHPTGTVSLKYRFDDERSVYFKYSHGWKGAQFNARNGIVANKVTDVASPEQIDAFELGIAGNWLDGRLQLNGAFFWYKYENYQVFTFTNDAREAPQRIVLNANDARLFGAELEGTVEPIDRLIFNVKFGWLESKFLDFTDTGARPVPGSINDRFQQVFDFNGNPLPNAPRFKVAASAEYTIELGSLGALIPRYDLTWTDKVYFDPTKGRGNPDLGGNSFLPANTIGQDAFALHNIRLTYRAPSGEMEISGWVRNITNEIYKTLAFDANQGPGIVGSLIGDPRTYGLSVNVSF